MDKQDILDLIDNGHDMEEYETMWEFFEAMNSMAILIPWLILLLIFITMT